MKITEVAQPKVWRVLDAADPRRINNISGWDFGGSGPLALLHHANGMCGAMWAEVAQQLSARYRVFAMDARGHGDSGKLTVPDDYDWRYFAHDVAAVATQLCSEFDQPLGRLQNGFQRNVRNLLHSPHLGILACAARNR